MKQVSERKQHSSRTSGKNVLGYFKILTDGTTVEIKPLSVKQENEFDVLQNYAHPFSPDTLRFENHTFVLNKKLVCVVEYQEDMYFISYGDLDISVWGRTREEAEEAFAFTFYSLYLNYCIEKDEKLSFKARELKRKLKSIIKNYHKL
ncbi:MAG: hypothetical protein KGZ58_08195 [Ignavibacteriales bacterium]|nr:hypothetical protein [Ignavibacteriales bacterium]